MCKEPRKAFSIVELIVVLALLLLLLAMLSPLVDRLKDSAKTTECLSNLRQLGAAHSQYIAQSGGYVVPSDYTDWQIGPQPGTGYNINEGWATIFVATKLVNYPGAGAAGQPGNIFRCPIAAVGIFPHTNDEKDMPDSRGSDEGAKPYQYISRTLMPGLAVDVSYGINGCSDGEAFIPCRRWPADRMNPDNTIPLVKMESIRNPAGLVFLFDGVGFDVQTRNANRLNARHNEKSKTNILFFDGHAETFVTSRLPGGDGNAGKTAAGAKQTFSLQNLKNYPYPKWRMDQ